MTKSKSRINTTGTSAIRYSRNPKIVTHFIAGYPNHEISLEIARGLIAGGAYALEMQIPFSDPNADGPVIEGACREVLKSGFRTADAWRLLKAIRADSDIPIFVMSYASMVVTPGVRAFVQQGKEAGASGFIIPDLVPGSDEGLFAMAAEIHCPAVPVVVPWIADARLDEILCEPIDWIYVALRSGITGTYTEIGSGQHEFLKKIRAHGVEICPGLQVMAGFGIQNMLQVKMLSEMADAVIVGSALVKTIAEAVSVGVDHHPGVAEDYRSMDRKSTGDMVRKRVEELRGC